MQALTAVGQLTLNSSKSHTIVDTMQWPNACHNGIQFMHQCYTFISVSILSSHNSLKYANFNPIFF